MSFQNWGRTPSGRKFYRGEAILVEHTTHLLSGRISEISTGDGGESVIFPTVDQGVLNTMGGDASKNVPDTAYLAQGFHHQSTTQSRVGGAKPSLFCFADEEPTFAMAGTGDAERPPVVDEVTQAEPVTGGNQGATAPLPELPPKTPEPEFDPRDADHSGTVSSREKKEWKKTHPEG